MSTDPFGLVGQVLDGQFRVDELVGEGGFSAVYRGHNVGLNEPIAIKCLKLPVALQTSLVDTFVQRFRDESRILYRLSQGNLHIVRSIGAGTTTTSAGVLVPFMVLEWLEGRSLAVDFGVRRELGKKGRSASEVVSTFASAADALAFAHAQGVVHRDLNPGNLFLASTRRGLEMKVLDFGVAKVMHDSTLGLGPRAQTMQQLRVFAPAYGAPEQFDDKLGAVGAAADVYSFALVLLEALRDAPLNEAANLADFARLATDPARRPTPRSLGLTVADEVEAVFARATQLDPRQRWQTAAELWGALTSAVASSREKVPARPSVKAPPPPAKTLPLGASMGSLPRPALRQSAGSPASAPKPGLAGANVGGGPGSAVGSPKATQRFGEALPLPPSAAASPSEGGLKTPVAPRPPSMPPPAGDDEEDGDEPTRVAAAAMDALRGTGPSLDDPTPTEPPPAVLSSMPPLPTVVGAPSGPLHYEGEIEPAPDSGGTLVMAPGQTSSLGISQPAAPSHHGYPTAPQGAGFASTMAFGSQMTPYPQPGGAPPYAAQPGQSQPWGQQPPMNPGQSQLYPPGQPGQGPHGGPMHGMPDGYMRHASMSGPGMPLQGYGAPAGAYAALAGAAPAKKGLPVAVLVAAGVLLLLALGGIGVFVVGRETAAAAPAASASAATVEPSPSSAPPADTTPPGTPQGAPPAAVPAVGDDVGGDVGVGPDAGSAAAEPSAAPTATEAPAATTTAAPVYTWPPPGARAQPSPQPAPTQVAPKVGSAPADPDAFNESAARARLNQANGVLAFCKREGGVTGKGTAMVTFASDGAVSSVSLDAPFVGTKEGDCAAGQFKRVKALPFVGTPQTLKHAFEIPK